MENIIHEEAERIKQNIINEFGKNNVLDLHVELNDDGMETISPGGLF